MPGNLYFLEIVYELQKLTLEEPIGNILYLVREVICWVRFDIYNISLYYIKLYYLYTDINHRRLSYIECRYIHKILVIYLISVTYNNTSKYRDTF